MRRFVLMLLLAQALSLAVPVMFARSEEVEPSVGEASGAIRPSRSTLIAPSASRILVVRGGIESDQRDVKDFERAFALPIGGEGRDAFVMRGVGGDGLVVFQPRSDGGFERQVLPGMGADIQWFGIDDVDSDGSADLIVKRTGTDLALWRGDGKGNFLEPDWIPKASHVGHMAYAAGDSSPGDGDEDLEERRAGHPTDTDELDRPGRMVGRDMEHLQASAEKAMRNQRLQVGAVGPSEVVGQIMEHEGGVSLTVGDFGGGSGRDLAVATTKGTVLVFRNDGLGGFEKPEVISIGFVPRVIAAGHFTRSDRIDLAVAGIEARPSFVVLENKAPGVEADRGAPSSRGFVARDMTAPFSTVTVNVGQGGLTFSPSPANIVAGDTVRWVWATGGHSVTSGVMCNADGVFCSPNNTNCASGTTSAMGFIYQRVFPTPGTFRYFCVPHCAAGMTGIVSVAAAPGAVPDGSVVTGTELKVTKIAGGNIQLTWGASCSASVSNYAVYEGTLPIAGVYNHVARNCALGNVLMTSLAPSAGNRYYLIVPETAANEGSYGQKTGGVERPQGGGACKPRLVGCP